MSSRALRKAQREREEHEKVQEQESEEEDETLASSAKQSAFAMLAGEEDEAGEDEAVPDEHDETDETASSKPAAAAALTPKPSSKKKKKRNKKKAKGESGTASPMPIAQDEQLDDIDRALQQLSTSGNTSSPATTSSGVDREIDEMSGLLAIDTSHLHAQNEMRRLFGRAALDPQDEDGQQAQANAGGNRRQQRRVNQMGGLAEALRRQQGGQGGMRAIALRRNLFVQGKDEWPQATSGGLGMEVEEKRADGTVLYRFVHNRVYEDVQRQFAIAQESMDPNLLVVLLQQNPYHISTLLQVSEIAKHDRDHAVAGDLLERALFSFGRAVHSSLAKTLGEGKARLDFRRPESRECWLASWRYMQNLSMRATWRTVYEWARLTLGWSPEEDPYAMWLVLDQYALRARQDLDFLNLGRSPAFQAKTSLLPNVQLSQGLAEFRSGNPSKGRQALFKAVGKYPWVVARLMQDLGLDPPPGVWGKEPRTEKEKLYSEMYATRAKDLWITPEATALLVEVASALPPDTASAAPDTSEISQNEARHVILADVPQLTALLPRTFTLNTGSSSDPLPPGDTYPTTSFTSQRPRQQLSEGAIEAELRDHTSFFHQVFPWLFPTTTRPPGSDGLLSADAEPEVDGDQDGIQPLDEETVNRAVQESGIERGEVMSRLRRLAELEQFREMVGWQRAEEAADAADEAAIVPDETGMRARIGDAPETGD